jgi:oligosaccharide repeat unit polymerase
MGVEIHKASKGHLTKRSFLFSIGVTAVLAGICGTGFGIASSNDTLNLIGLSTLGIGIFVTAYYYYDDLFSPIGLIGVGWFLPLAISQLYLSDHQQVFDSLTFGAVLGSALSFIVGVLSVVKVRALQTTFKKKDWFAFYDPMRLRLGVTALSVAATIAYWYEARAGVGIPLLMPAEERTLAYVTLPQRYIHYLTVSSIPAAALAIAYIRAYGYRKSLWESAILVLLMALLFSILARLQIIMVLLCGLSVANYTIKRLSLKSVAILSTVLLMGFVWLSEFRTGADVDYARRIYLLSGLPEWADVAAWPYAYISLNFEFLRRVIHGDYPRTFGIMSFRPLLAFSFTRELFPLPDFETEWFNTGTYLWEVYSDFGIGGCLTIPFLYGVLVGLFYKRVRTCRTMATVLIYGFVMYSVIFLFQGNSFAYPPLYFFAFEIWIVTKIAQRKKLSCF